MLKQILPSKKVKTIAADRISKDKIQACRDSKGHNYILSHDCGAWRAYTFGEASGYDIVLSSQSGIIDDFVGIVEKYVTLGWGFYELQDVRDLVGWLAKGNLAHEWNVPDKPDKKYINHIINGQGDGTDTGLMETVQAFLINRGISESNHG